jgi:hypothetical protein
MPREKTHLPAYSAAKNAVRGALSNKKGKPVAALSAGLNELNIEDVPKFAAWVYQYPAKRARLFPPSKIEGYAGLWPDSFLSIANLPTALSWLAQFFSRHADSIHCFLRHLEAYELASLSGDYEAALLVLDRIQAELGLSIWLIEARIAITHRHKGLEVQKQYTQSIQTAAPKKWARLRSSLCKRKE